MCYWNRLKELPLIPRITFVGMVTAIFAVGIAFASESDILDTASKMEKMSAIGILSIGFLASLFALITLIKLQYGKMLEVIENNTKVMARLTKD